MEGGKPGLSHSKDIGWSKFEEYAKQRVVGGATGLPGSRNPLSPTTGRLHKEDMAIYGREPATDNMLLVVCELCGRVVKSQALLKHRELYHSEAIRSPPLSLRRPTDPVQTYGQSSSMGSGTTKKSKECDLDRHCGVWIEADKRPCRRSITCKNHSLELRQKVTGRSRPFSELLDEYKKWKKTKKKEERARLANSARPPPLSPLVTSPSSNVIVSGSPISSSPPHLPPPLPTLTSIATPVAAIDRSPLPSSALVYLDGSDDEGLGMDTNSQETLSINGSEGVFSEEQLYPKPAAVNNFSCRHMSQGFSTYSHRQDILRSSLVSLTGREREFQHTPDSSVHRQLNHLSQQRHVQKKYSYLGKQNHILLSYSARHSVTSSTSAAVTMGSSSATVTTPLTSFVPASFYSTNTQEQMSTSNSKIESATMAARSRNSSLSALSNEHSASSNRRYDNHETNDRRYDSRESIDEEEEEEKGRRRSLRMKREQNHCEVPPLSLHPKTPSYNSADHLMKLGHHPLSMNGLANSPVQPFSVNSSSQTYVINPSQHVLPRTMLPISGLGIPHQMNNPSTLSNFSPASTLPLSLLPDQLNSPMLHQLLPQRHMWMTQSSSGPPGYESANHSTSVYPHSVTAATPEGYTHHHTSSNENLMTNQFQSQSPSKFCLPMAPNLTSPLAMQHQMTGLVQSPATDIAGAPVDDGTTAILPPGIASSSPPRLHRLTPANGNQGPGSSYRQSALVASQSVTQRTQQVS